MIACLKPGYCQLQFEELNVQSDPKAVRMLPLDRYDVIIVAFSGGKDSLDCILYLRHVLGVPAAKIWLWHHLVDGAPGSPSFFDWPVTEAYVRAAGEALGIRLEYQWRQGGFLGELLRHNSLTGDVQYMRGGGTETLPTTHGRPSTRRRWPAKSADLRTRYCSAYLKIDVARRCLNNHPDLQDKTVLFVSGERREESPARSRYLEIESHPCSRRDRRVDWWRPVIDFREEKVWDLIEKHRIHPHPAYLLGFGRTSCLTCIFLAPDLWATVKEIAPDHFARLAEMEKELDFTIDSRLSLEEMAAGGRPRMPKTEEVYRLAKRSMEGKFCSQDFFVDEWELPSGAFSGAAGGPT